MKGKRRLLSVLMIIGAFIIMQLPVKEADASTSASPFKMEGSKLVKYRGTDKNVSIPGTVEVIGKGAFEGNDTVEVVAIPASVIRIDPYAFWGCEKLERIIIGNGLLEIGDYAFTNCVGLTDMTIPSNIRRIGIQAFADCVNLEEITIPFQVTEIHETAFDGCRKLVINCERGTYADEYAQEFYERQKKMQEYEDVQGDTDEVTEPVETLKPAMTPEPVYDDKDLLGSTYIVDNQAVIFLDNNEPIVYGTEATEEPEATENQNAMVEPEATAGPGVQTSSPIIGESTVVPKYSVIDNRVIADQAYYQSSKRKEVTLPDGIEEIGEFSFARSTLEKVTLPDSLETICYGAFYYCSNLETVVLPDGIRNIEPKAFSQTGWVQAFLKGDTEEDSNFLISGGVLVAYRGDGDNVTIPEGVKVIAAEAFMNHSEITQVCLPDSLLVIGEGAFEGCVNIEQLNLGNGIEEMKDRAFWGCNKLSKIRLPKSLSKLGLKVFEDTVKISYEGEIPLRTHETSAERLSNEEYRVYGKFSGEQGVTVSGINRAYATLSGASKCYNLQVDVLSDGKLFEKAFVRNLHATLPRDALLFQMILTDGSEIPLSKLGKQILTVTLPIPESFYGQELKVYGLDRNGQLELLPSMEVRVDGTDSVQFMTDYVSAVAICSDGVLTEEVSIISMSGEANKTVGGNFAVNIVKWVLIAIVLLCGVGFVFKKHR